MTPQPDIPDQQPAPDTRGNPRSMSSRAEPPEAAQSKDPGHPNVPQPPEPETEPADADFEHRPDELDADRIREAHRRMLGLPGDAGVEERVGANQRFHRSIWRAAGNRTVQDMLARLYLHVVRQTTLDDPERWARALEEH